MKVGISILRSFNKGLGGDFQSIDLLAGKLQEMGIKVVVLSSKFDYDCKYERRKFTNLPWNNDLTLPISIIRYIKETIHLSHEVDIINCHLDLPSFMVIGDAIRSKIRIPVVVTLGIPYISNYRKVLPYLLKAPVYYGIRLLINNRIAVKFSRFACDKYVVSSHYQKRQLVRVGIDPQKLIEIPNGVDTEIFKMHDKSRSREEFGFSKDEYIITYIGHFRHSKGIGLLINAFNKVLKDYPNSKLVLAWSDFGSKEYVLKEVKRFGVSDKVVILGRIHVARLFSATDVIVLPYLFDFGTHMFPCTLLEAISVGIPVVSTDYEIFKEVIQNGRTGLLNPPGRPDEIAKSIIKLLSDSFLRKKMVSEQRKLAMERFDSEVIARQYIDLYQDVLRG